MIFLLRQVKGVGFFKNWFEFNTYKNWQTADCLIRILIVLKITAPLLKTPHIWLLIGSLFIVHCLLLHFADNTKSCASILCPLKLTWCAKYNPSSWNESFSVSKKIISSNVQCTHHVQYRYYRTFRQNFGSGEGGKIYPHVMSKFKIPLIGGIHMVEIALIVIEMIWFVSPIPVK